MLCTKVQLTQAGQQFTAARHSRLCSGTESPSPQNTQVSIPSYGSSILASELLNPDSEFQELPLTDPNNCSSTSLSKPHRNQRSLKAVSIDGKDSRKLKPVQFAIMFAKFQTMVTIEITTALPMQPGFF